MKSEGKWLIHAVLMFITFGISTLVLAAGPLDEQSEKIEIHSGSNKIEILAVDYNTGAQRLIYTAEPGAVRDSLVTLSPDEKYVALVEITNPETMAMTSKLILIDLESNEAVDLVLPQDGAMPTNPLWSPDSTHLAYVWFNPARASVELWLVDPLSGQQRRLVAEDRFWTVLVYGKTHSIAWEASGQAIQFVDDRSGQIYRATMGGELDKVPDQEEAAAALQPHSQLKELEAAPASYVGMEKPLNIRDYNDTCHDGYTGLYPNYGGCVLWGPHPGVDMSAGSTGITCGTPVKAICTGPIIAVETSASAAANGVCNPNTGGGSMNLGWQVVLRCDNIPNEGGYGGTIYAIYAHLRHIEPGLGWGVWVDKGTKLGEVGSTGYSLGPHLHFQMERDNQPYHPWWWNTESEILAYTWNPMYFIQAHEDYDPGPGPVEPQETACLKHLLRYWHDGFQKHFYTEDWGELGGGSDGWVYEGLEGYVAKNSSCYAPSARPFYRFYSSSRNKHFYTASETERQSILNSGYYQEEGIVGYVLLSSNSQYYTQPLYRAVLPQPAQSSEDHFYTTDWNEMDYVVNQYGYIYEGVVAHVFKSAALAPTPVPTPEIVRRKVYLPLVVK